MFGDLSRLSAIEHVLPGKHDPRFPRPRKLSVKGSLLFLAMLAGVVSFFVLRPGGGEDRRAFTFGPSVERRTLPQVGAWLVVGGPFVQGGRASAAVARETERIAGSDTTLARLMRRGDGQRLGNVDAPFESLTTVVYKLKRPITVNANLPYMMRPPDGPSHGDCVRPYAAGWAHLRARGVTRLSVIVDLSSKRVAQISGNAKRGRVGPVAGKPYPTCNEDQPG